MSVLQCVVIAAPIGVIREFIHRRDPQRSDTTSTSGGRPPASRQDGMDTLLSKFRDPLAELRVYLDQHQGLPIIVLFSLWDEEFLFYTCRR